MTDDAPVKEPIGEQRSLSVMDAADGTIKVRVVVPGCVSAEVALSSDWSFSDAVAFGQRLSSQLPHPSLSRINGLAIDLRRFAFLDQADKVAEVCGSTSDEATALAERLEQLADQSNGGPVTTVDVAAPDAEVEAPIVPMERSYKCDDCPKAFATANGLGIHRGRSHPDAPGRAAAPQNPSTEAGLALRCDDCKFTARATDFDRLRAHTMTKHGGRLPSRQERMAR